MPTRCALLDALRRQLSAPVPESATSLGIDTGARASLRGQLGDRSPQGRQRITDQLRADLQRVTAFDTSGLSHAMRTSFEVVRSAYATSLEGFALPYGDVAGWQLAQHAVCRHPERRRLSRRPALPRQRPSHRERRRCRGVSRAAAVVCEAARRRAGTDPGRARRRARAAGVPDRQGARADAPVGEERARRRQRSSSRSSGGRRPSPATGPSARERSRRRRSRRRSSGRLPSCRPSGRSATNDAGMWARPRGEEYYRWALKASTTTSMSPDEIHEMGRSELERLHAQMDRDPERRRLLARHASASE